MNNIEIKLLIPEEAKSICKSITKTLVEWFGIPEANERYSRGMIDKISFGAYIKNSCVGMISLEFPFSNNANIFWMGIEKNYHNKSIGKQLIKVAENYCIDQQYSSLTVETLSPRQQDEYYKKTYQFYEKMGFKPLFELKPYGPDNLMVYMYKPLKHSKNVKISEEDLKLVPATKNDYSTLFNLARFYSYDISEFFGDDPGWEMEDDGLYGVGVDYKKYFEDENAFPFLARYKGELAGFAIVDKDSIDPSADFNMAQFFILRIYKRKGLGKLIAFECFEKFKGTWEVHVMPKNETARHFWRSIIAEYTKNNFNEEILKNKNREERITFHFRTI